MVLRCELQLSIKEQTKDRFLKLTLDFLIACGLADESHLVTGGDGGEKHSFCCNAWYHLSTSLLFGHEILKLLKVLIFGLVGCM